MATAAPSRPSRSSPRKAPKPHAARKAGASAKAHKPKSSGGSGVAKTLAKSSAHAPSKLTRKATLTIAKLVARRALSAGTEAVSQASRHGVQRAALAVGSLRNSALAAAGTSVDVEANRRPPIQASVDVAVPIRLAWRQWARLEWLPEGVDSVLEVERHGNGKLRGQLGAEDGRKWAARILDEREEESFAWESVQGSDCAGLITFNPLGERMTRIEISLDVRPVSIGQAAALSTRRADRRATADLRRFKARLELINPDSYPDVDE